MPLLPLCRTRKVYQVSDVLLYKLLALLMTASLDDCLVKIADTNKQVPGCRPVNRASAVGHQPSFALSHRQNMVSSQAGAMQFLAGLNATGPARGDICRMYQLCADVGSGRLRAV